MGKVAAVFPGQGSQSVGMGKELAEAYPVVAETFREADRILGLPLSQLCFEGPEEELTLTRNTQPALLTASVATFRLLREKGFQPAAAAGHSLGEYSALVAAGAISFEEALVTVRLRGELMESAVPAGEGSMAAILGLDRGAVEAICKEIEGVVEPATYNSPGQVVVAGESGAVEAAMKLAQERGARRVQLLKVSGPFHSSLLRPAGERLAERLAAVTLRTPEVPVYANVTARPYTSPDEIRSLLQEQVSSPVRWEETVEAMWDAGIDTFVEIGPGRVLSGLIRRIRKDATVHNVESVATLQELLGA